MGLLGVIIRKSRTDLGLKVYELARGVGVTPVYITKIEKNGQLPSPHVMRRISSILHNKRLFDLYLKMKYPMVYSKIHKGKNDPGFKTINKVFKDELRKIKKRLERIEKRIN